MFRHDKSRRRVGRFRAARRAFETLESRTVLSANLFTEQIVLDGADVNAPIQGTVGDLNQDGHPDLIIGGHNDQNLKWFPGAGGNTYLEPRLVRQVAGTVHAIHAADMNGDGDLDILVVAGGSTTWYENRNNATEFVYGGTFEYLSEMDLKDFDADGDIDIVGSGIDLLLFENQGDGTFARHVLPGLSHSPDLVQFVDVDSDGQLDIAFSEENRLIPETNIKWLKFVAGEFTPQAAIVTSSSPIWAFDFSDLDGDSDADVAFVQISQQYTLRTIENVDNMGTFGEPTTVVSTDNGLGGTVSLSLVGVDDLDGDDLVDFVIVTYEDGVGAIKWLRNSGQAFDAPQTISAASPVFRPSTVLVADLDGDQDADMVAMYLISDRITVVENLAGGNFGPEIDVADSGIANLASSIAMDVDNDSDLDLVALSGTAMDTGRIFWYENLDGLGTFASQRLLQDIESGYHTLKSADIDGDGDSDIYAYGYRQAWFENQGNRQYAKHDLFPEPNVIIPDFDDDPSFLYNFDLHAIDVDGDGDLDLSGVNRDSLIWFEQTAAAQFAVSQDIDVMNDSRFEYVAGFAANDFDGDGDADFIATKKGNGSDNIIWIENQPDQSRFVSHPIASQDDPETFLVADIDGNGGLDLVYYAEEDEVTRLHLNQSSGSRFGPPRTLQNDFEINNVALSDLDGDGDYDYLAARSSSLFSFENNGEIGHGFNSVPHVLLSNVYSARGFTADLDNDGDLDFVLRSAPQGMIAWYRNESTNTPGDFNGDGSFNAKDVDTLRLGIRSRSDAPKFDVNSDGMLDQTDLTSYLHNQFNATLGDVNLDGTVDATDFSIIRENLFEPPHELVHSWGTGDLNGDAVVDVSDFNIWNVNKFSIVASVISNAEPEPFVTPTDVNGDGEVTPLDALQVLSYLNGQETTEDRILKLDVDRSGTVTPLDALRIINALNAPTSTDIYFAAIDEDEDEK